MAEQGPGRYHTRISGRGSPRLEQGLLGRGDQRGARMGCGACDMKSGTTASIFTYVHLAPLKERLAGRLTLTVLSDQETFGEWGARILVANHPEVLGDCCLSAEPSSRHTLPFGEKGLIGSASRSTRGVATAPIHIRVRARPVRHASLLRLRDYKNFAPACRQTLRGQLSVAARRLRPAWAAGDRYYGLPDHKCRNAGRAKDQHDS